MRLYKTIGVNITVKMRRIKWSGTQVDARADRKALKEEGFGEPDTQEVDVPTDKQGLLAWLNENATGE